MDDSRDLADETPSLQTDLTDSDSQAKLKTQMVVEKAIRVNMAKIERLKEDVKPVREMFNSFLDGDEEYKQRTEEAKIASKNKSVAKSRLLQTENGKELNGKLTLLKEELVEAQEALSHYLAEYQLLTGVREFEGEDGELRQIVMVAKLVRKTNLER